MVRRWVSWLLVAMLLFANALSCAEGFSDNPDAIEETVKAVVMLYATDNKNKKQYTGSGFIAFDEKTLVTNYHVIAGCDEVFAETDDGQRFRVNKALCGSEDADVAILHFTKDMGFTPLPLYADDSLKRGAKVVAIGSPEKQKNTVSMGEVGRIFTEDGIPRIQFTAPISHGSSGGALLNDNGEVIGITSAFLAEEYSQNINYAVNIVTVKALYAAWEAGNRETFSIAECPAASEMAPLDSVYDPRPASATPTPAPTSAPTARAEKSAPSAPVVSVRAEADLWLYDKNGAALSCVPHGNIFSLRGYDSSLGLFLAVYRGCEGYTDGANLQWRESGDWKDVTPGALKNYYGD